MDSPICLIDIDDYGKCSLNPEAIEILSHITTDICVVAVAGLYRTGKSYLLNRFMDRQNGFEIGPTVRACTKGIWMWGEVQPLGSNLSLVLIDTEGLQSTNRDSTSDMTIFSLSVLLSSVFVYNSIGAISEASIEELSLVCNLTDNIRVKAGSSDSPEAYAAYFPQFVWVMRDFGLRYIDEETGEKIDSDTYLENSLKSIPGSDPDTLHKNQIRSTIRASFRDRSCIGLPRPVIDESQLRHIEKLDYSEINSTFRKRVERLINGIRSNPRPKTIEGVGLNGKMFVEMLKAYADSINNNAIPTISTAWERTLMNQIRESYDSALETYREKCSELIEGSLPVPEDDLRSWEKSIREDCQEQLKKSVFTVALLPEREEYISKYLTACDENLNALLRTNMRESKKQCTEIIKEEFEELESKLLTSTDFSWISSEFSNIYDLILQKMKGPAVYESLAKAYSNNGSRLMSKLISQMSLQARQKYNALEAEFAKARGAYKENCEYLEGQIKNYESKLAYERQTQRDQKDQMEKALAFSKSQLKGKADKKKVELTEQREENMRLKNEVMEQRSQLQQMERDKEVCTEAIVDFQETMDVLKREMETLYKKKNTIQQDLEYEVKVKELQSSLQQKLNENNRANDEFINQLKKSYEEEIKSLRNNQKIMKVQLKNMAQDVKQRETQIRYYQEKLKSQETQQSASLEHSELLMSVSELILKFTEQLGAHDGNIRKEIGNLQKRASRMTRF